jgi:hypothetical protein
MMPGFFHLDNKVAGAEFIPRLCHQKAAVRGMDSAPAISSFIFVIPSNSEESFAANSA